jgi:hypothetical protein
MFDLFSLVEKCCLSLGLPYKDGSVSYLGVDSTKHRKGVGMKDKEGRKINKAKLLL